MYIYQYNTKNIIPDLEQIKSMFASADNPNPALCDQRPLNYVLTRLSSISPRLAGLILTRKTALTSFDYTIDSHPSIDYVKFRFHMNNVIADILASVINSQLFGISALCISWDLIDNLFWPRVQSIYKPFQLEYDVNGNKYLLNSFPDNSFSRTPLYPNENLLVITPDGFNQCPGGILRGILLYEYLRDRTLQEWHESNRRIKGLIQAKTPPELTQQTAEALNSILTSHYAVTPANVEFLLKDLVSGTAIESFPKLLNELKNEVAIAILGQANIVELPPSGGSRAALQILNLIRNDILFADMQLAQNTINNQLLLHFYRLNFDTNASYCPFNFNFLFDEIANLDTNIKALTFAKDINLPLSQDDIYHKLALQKPTKGVTLHNY